MSDEGQKMVPCDQCGRYYTFYELAETIEEYLCEACASGIDPEDPDDYYPDGQEYGYEDEP